MKAWITKYALTKGIWEAEVEKTDFPDMVVILTDDKGRKTETSLWTVWREAWHHTEREALESAIKMGEKKLMSLLKSATKFNKLLKVWRHRLAEIS